MRKFEWRSVFSSFSDHLGMQFFTCINGQVCFFFPDCFPACVVFLMLRFGQLGRLVFALVHVCCFVTT